MSDFAEVRFDGARQMPGEDLVGVRGEPAECDHACGDHVAPLGLNVVPSVGKALARLLAHRADHGLSGFAGLLADLEDLEDAPLLGWQRAVTVQAGDQSDAGLAPTPRHGFYGVLVVVCGRRKLLERAAGLPRPKSTPCSWPGRG
ncbi:hypothetical protein ACSNOH_01330 [Streptomyces sp. URMC 127]|uniref:hypothetical protein n=1 Tax=Streptomyces sp. URMC 127 TaxID=3423402 RepID=UPI003F1989EB